MDANRRSFLLAASAVAAGATAPLAAAAQPSEPPVETNDMPAWARECLDRRRAEGRRFAAVAIYSDDKRGAMVFAVDLEKGSGFQAFNADGRCLGHALADLAHRAAAERVPCTDPGCFACAR